MAQTSTLRTDTQLSAIPTPHTVPDWAPFVPSKRRAHPAPSTAASANALATYPTALCPSAVKGLLVSRTHSALTVEFPRVVDLLAYAEKNWTLPPDFDDIAVYALAALSVSTRPSKAAHWVFWNDRTRDLSMERCKKALSAKPCHIKFNGPLIDGYTLSRYHDSGWRKLIEGQPWYAQLAGKSPAGPSTRKRNREVLDNTPDASEAGVLEDSLPPAKRTRATRRKAAEASTTPPTVSPPRAPTPRAAPSTSNPKAASSRASTPRNLRRVTPKAQSAVPSSLSDPIIPSSDSTAPSATTTTTRQRSNSQTSGTLVASGSGSDRSQSVLTAVEPSPSPKSLPVHILAEEECGPRRSGRKRTTPAPMPTPPAEPYPYRIVKPRSPPQDIVEVEMSSGPIATMTEVKAPAKARRTKPGKK